MLATVLSLALVATAPQEAPPQVQDPTTADDPVALQDVVVTGRRLDDLIRDFVSNVAEPNPNRRLARWDDPICVGVANLKSEAAQYIADRVSTVASDVGLSIGDRGCSPNVLVIATNDASGLARELVSERGRAFRMGGSGMDRGRAALDDFQDASRPIRWWQLALPIDSETGRRAVRLPGDCQGNCTGSGSVMQYAPTINVFAASRLNTQIVDNLFRTIVIVDVDKVSDLSILQLSDYIAMVSLAQINPDADTSSYATILNVFEDQANSPSLTSWDMAYLQGLYGAEQGASNLRANETEISRSIEKEHQALREAELN